MKMKSKTHHFYTDLHVMPLVQLYRPQTNMYFLITYLLLSYTVFLNAFVDWMIFRKLYTRRGFPVCEFSCVISNYLDERMPFRKLYTYRVFSLCEFSCVFLNALVDWIIFRKLYTYRGFPLCEFSCVDLDCISE